MESIICSVKDIATADRRALEHVVGQQLADHHQLVIQIVNSDVPSTQVAPEPRTISLPDWCKVYDGLSDEEVSALEDIVLTRADLTREAE